MQAARYVANGALGYVYEADRTLRSLPLLPILLAPISLLGDHFHLTEPLPLPLEHPSMWLLAGPIMLATSIMVFISARSVLEVFGARMTASLRFWLFLLVFALMTWPYGHFEDVLAFSMLLFAIRDRYSGKPIRSAFMLGFAIAFKQWAAMGIPFFVLWTPRGERLRILLACTALPASLAIFTLAVDYKDAAHSLLFAANFPVVGHPAPWVGAHARSVSSGAFRLAALVIALALARVARNRQGEAFLGAMALALVARVVLEPVTHAYYLAPALGLLLLREQLVKGGIRRAALTGAVAAAIFAFNDHGSIWWVGMVLACLMAATPAIREVFQGQAETLSDLSGSLR